VLLNIYLYYTKPHIQNKFSDLKSEPRSIQSQLLNIKMKFVLFASPLSTLKTKSGLLPLTRSHHQLKKQAQEYFPLDFHNVLFSIK